MRCEAYRAPRSRPCKRREAHSATQNPHTSRTRKILSERTITLWVRILKRLFATAAYMSVSTLIVRLPQKHAENPFDLKPWAGAYKPIVCVDSGLQLEMLSV